MAKTATELVSFFQTITSKAEELDQLDVELRDLVTSTDKEAVEFLQNPDVSPEDRRIVQDAAVDFITQTFRRTTKRMADTQPKAAPKALPAGLGGFPELT